MHMHEKDKTYFIDAHLLVCYIGVTEQRLRAELLALQSDIYTYKLAYDCFKYV